MCLNIRGGNRLHSQLPIATSNCYVSILDDTYWGLIDVTIAFDAAISKYFEFGDEKVIW